MILEILCSKVCLPKIILDIVFYFILFFSIKISWPAIPNLFVQNNPKLEVLTMWHKLFSGILRLPNAKHDLLGHLDHSSNSFTSKLPQKIRYVKKQFSRYNYEGNIPYSKRFSGFVYKQAFR